MNAFTPLARHLAVAFFMVIGLVPSAGYLLLQFRDALNLVNRDAEIQARRVTAVITQYPEGWRHSRDQTNDAIEDVRHSETSTVVFDGERELLGIGGPRSSFFVSASAPIHDFGEDVGRVEVSKNMAVPLAIGSALAVVGLLLAAVFSVVLDRRVLRPLKQAQDQILQQAYHDALTNLPNRRLLADRLKQALEASERSRLYGAVMFMDLDHFKGVNDTQGHESGDLLLREVANRLVSVVRGEDSVARLGGDEFVILVGNLSDSHDEAAQLATDIGSKLLGSLLPGFVLADIGHATTASLGIVLFQGTVESVEDLLKHADAAMYQAKSAGRNTLRFFDPKMQQALDARSALRNDLAQALGQGQFRLHYQAQVEALDNITGAEVLIRWVHPVRGMVSPAEFIPLAEETGLILSIGRWVLETACDQLAQWTNIPPMAHLQLAVNVSARQFQEEDFVGTVKRALERSGANPRRLKLELTESMVIGDVERNIVKMRAIKAMGVSFSLDDFGTGYSSLSYLKRLPLDQIKIDQSFVRDIGEDADDTIIVQTIVAMASSLGFAIIAEGVETQTQKAFLASIGCAAYQGYLFSAPVPLKDFEHLAGAGVKLRLVQPSAGNK